MEMNANDFDENAWRWWGQRLESEAEVQWHDFERNTHLTGDWIPHALR